MPLECRREPVAGENGRRRQQKYIPEPLCRTAPKRLLQ